MRVGELRRVLRDSGVLGEAGGEPTPAELADVLWLAALRQASRPISPADTEDMPAADVAAEIEERDAAGMPEPQPVPMPRSDVPEPIPTQPPAVSPVLANLPRRGVPSLGVMVSAAARPQLPDSLSLARAMRPLRHRVPSVTRYVLDEEATADLRAEQRLWLPALAPGNEPAFDLALVVDDGDSMALWGAKVREFRLLCERLGAFRDTRLWRLSATRDDTAAKPVLRGLSSRSPVRDERELIDPSGRRLILVVTDGVHPRWRSSGPLGPVLARWALASPLAIVQMFPQRLWNRSPLRPVIEEFQPGWPGSGPTIRCPDQGSVVVPILELAPAAMRRWVGIISGTSGITPLPAAALSQEGAGEDETPWSVRNGNGADDGELDPARLVHDFRASVSPAAYQLAGYLSAAPLTLPVMRLVQESMMPATGSAELAEVFLSGLLRRSADGDPAADAENALYVFAAGVRNMLQSTLTRGEALSVLDKVGSYLVWGRPGGRPFPVLLRGQPSYSDIQAAAEQFPATFGRIAGPLLDRIAGPYADAIRHEATPTASAREELRGGGPTGWTAYSPGLTAGGGNGGLPPPPPPHFLDRDSELDEVYNGVTSLEGNRFWLTVASPQLGKTWFLRQIPEMVRTRWRDRWVVRWVDARDLPPKIAGDADAILLMMLGRRQRDGTGLADAHDIAKGMIKNSQYHLCLLDSAELLDDRTIYRLRQHLSEIDEHIRATGADARIAVIAASRRDRGWTGLDPARPPQIRRLAEFSVLVVQESLEKLAEREGHRIATPERRQHAVRVHQLSEGLPALLTGCIDWTSQHWTELHRLRDRDIFHEIAAPYVEDVLLSPSGLRGSGPMSTDEQQAAIRQTLRALSPFRIFTGSHLSNLADRDELRDALTRVGWSAHDLWTAVSDSDLLYRSEKGAWLMIDPPIRRLLFRYWYSSEAERGRVNREALAFLQPFALHQAGTDAADMLVECLWHMAQALILSGRSAELEPSMTGLAGDLSARLEPIGSADIAYLRGYTAERIREDVELSEALRDIPGLLDRVAGTVLHPEPEHL